MAQSNALSMVLLAEQFAKFPGIGQKAAQRLAYHVMNLSDEQVKEFVNAVLNAHEKVHCCPVCQNLTDMEVCPICKDVRRDHSQICVVETPKDISAFESSGEYHGVYHVLHGLLSPLDGMGPDDIRIRELLERVKTENIQEVVMALRCNVTGETTAIFIANLLKPLGIKVTQLATGLPSGANLEYADGVTLSNAFKYRNEI